MALALDSFSMSATAMIPSIALSVAKSRGVLPSSPKRFKVLITEVVSIPTSSNKRRFPAYQAVPFTVARIPLPKMAVKSDTGAGTIFLSLPY